MKTKMRVMYLPQKRDDSLPYEIQVWSWFRWVRISTWYSTEEFAIAEAKKMLNNPIWES